MTISRTPICPGIHEKLLKHYEKVNYQEGLGAKLKPKTQRQEPIS